MQLRRNLLMQMTGGNAVLYKSGTFTGDGTKVHEFDLGFEPDAIIITAEGLDYTSTSWGGLWMALIIKGRLSFNYMKPTTDTSLSTTQSFIPANTDPYGNDLTGNYRSCGSYNNGIFTFTNKSTNYRINFISGVTYSWAAYKKE